MNKLIRVNRNEVVMVLRVDREKGYIDLSKRRVDPDSIAKCEDRYNKAKAVHRVLRQVSYAYCSRLPLPNSTLGWKQSRRLALCARAIDLLGARCCQRHVIRHPLF